MQRKGRMWTVSKLDFLEKYLSAFNKASKRAEKTFYVDGFAGPGINQMPDGTARNGSPLIALNTRPAFTHHFLVEKHKKAFNALQDHVQRHGMAVHTTLYNADFNEVIDDILVQLPTYAPTFFLVDPEGLDISWQTMQKIGRRKKADVFILISSSGIARNMQHENLLTRFFGDESWREIPHRITQGEFGAAALRDEAFTRHYVEKLKTLGFDHAEYFLMAVTAKNRVLHVWTFVAKHEVAIKIAGDVMRDLGSGLQDTLF